MLFRRVFPVAITISVGWLILISFLPLDPASPLGAGLINLRAVLVEWGVILAAGALILGFINLIVVHARRIRQGQGVIFSVALIAFALITLGLWFGGELQGDSSSVLDTAFDFVIAPMQSALGVLLAILLAVAGFRALRVRRTVGMVLFVFAAVIVALTQPALPAAEPILRPIRDVIDSITTGSLRGLLLGVALGSVAFGLRLLVGVDKPQGD